MVKDSQGRTILAGDGSYRFRVVIDGEDLLVQDADATVFGGKHDKGDDGKTASGVPDNQDPWATPLGCALPMSGAHKRSTEGSPLPKFPYLTTRVRVYNRDSHRTMTLPLIDLGPSKPPVASGASIDLTESAFASLGGVHRRGHMRVDYRVLGGTKYLPAHVKRAMLTS